jgi:cytochrome bd-type quinol oxidase subunit 2
MTNTPERNAKRRPSPPVYRTYSNVREDVGGSVAMGLLMATGFSAFVLVMALLRGSTVYDDVGGMRTWQIIVFYYSAGVVGGIVHGLLRPLRERYWGKLLTAYLLLFLVYGGGTIAFWPMMSQDFDSPRLTLGLMLKAWGVLCLVLAPIYVKGFDGR